METNCVSNLMIIQCLLERLHKGWLTSSWSEIFKMMFCKLWIVLIVVSSGPIANAYKEVEASGSCIGVSALELDSTPEPRKTTKPNSTKTTKPNKTTKRTTTTKRSPTSKPTTTTKRSTTSKSGSNSSPGYYPNNNINCDIDYNEYLEVDIMPIEPDPVVMPIDTDYAQYLKVCGGSASINSFVQALTIITITFIFN